MSTGQRHLLAGRAHQRTQRWHIALCRRLVARLLRFIHRPRTGAEWWPGHHRAAQNATAPRADVVVGRRDRRPESNCRQPVIIRRRCAPRCKCVHLSSSLAVAEWSSGRASRSPPSEREAGLRRSRTTWCMCVQAEIAKTPFGPSGLRIASAGTLVGTPLALFVGHWRLMTDESGRWRTHRLRSLSEHLPSSAVAASTKPC